MSTVCTELCVEVLFLDFFDVALKQSYYSTSKGMKRD